MLRPALLGLGSIGAACVMAVNVRYAIATSDTQIDATIASIYMAMNPRELLRLASIAPIATSPIRGTRAG